MTLRAHQPTGLRIGGRSRRPPVLPILLAVSAAANAFFLLRWAPKEHDPDPALADAALDAAAGLDAPPAAPSAATAPAAPVAGDAPALAPAGDAAGSAVVAPEADGRPAAVAPGQPRSGHVVIDGAVSRDFVTVLGEEGERVALTASRLLVWNLDLTKDPRKGDEADVTYRLSATGDPDVTIDAVRYRSQKFDKAFEAYRFQPEGWAFPAWFDAQGQEVAGRLKSGPIEDYEEITSLIGDGRGHAGMDFKAPVGSAVVVPFAGTVTRVNWNWKYNGNCLEVKRSDGSLIRFLHLSEVADGVVPGSKVAAGQRIGASGNTGRSFAPHLHYELKSASDRTLDPLKVHGITRRTLPEASRAAFDAHVAAARAAWGAPAE
jgi:murein DD-endopeptidase